MQDRRGIRLTCCCSRSNASVASSSSSFKLICTESGRLLPPPLPGGDACTTLYNCCWSNRTPR